MTHNILLTSLSPIETDMPVRYFSVKNGSGLNYFDALMDAEAGIKSVLSRYDIDDVREAAEKMNAESMNMKGDS